MPPARRVKKASSRPRAPKKKIVEVEEVPVPSVPINAVAAGAAAAAAKEQGATDQAAFNQGVAAGTLASTVTSAPDQNDPDQFEFTEQPHVSVRTSPKVEEKQPGEGWMRKLMHWLNIR